MFQPFARAACVAAALAAGALGLVPAEAAAAPVARVTITSPAVQVEQVQYRHDRRDRYDRRGGACSIRRALGKAERMGIRRARVVRETRRTVTVAGRSFRGGRTFVTFGNRGGCPVLDVNR